MKISTLLTAGLYLLLASRSITAGAADPRFNGGYAAPARGFLGLPMPQQWSGARPMGMTGSANGYGYRSTGYNPACPNGNCSSGYRGVASNCPNGQCQTGAYPVGACANGQCSNYGSMTGVLQSGSCPNGNCGTGAYTNNRYPIGAQSDWSPRSTRTGLVDDYRWSGSVNDRDAWTQRTARPVLAPLDDAFNSRYRQDDLNLRNEYFGNDPRSRMNSNEWNRPSRRSLEVPSDSDHGVARF